MYFTLLLLGTQRDGVPLIRTCYGVNLFVCCLVDGVISGITHICMFLKTNGLFLSLSRAFLIPNNTGKNVSNCISKWTHGGCLGAGGEERGCLGQEESLGEMEMYILIGEGDLQARILSKLINRCCLLY